MPFLTLSNVQIDFNNWELKWRLYISVKVLPTAQKIKLIEKKEFGAATLNPDDKTFIVHITSIASSDLANSNLANSDSTVHSFCQAQIVPLKVEETFTTILSEYTDFVDILF